MKRTTMRKTTSWAFGIVHDTRTRVCFQASVPQGILLISSSGSGRLSMY